MIKTKHKKRTIISNKSQRLLAKRRFSHPFIVIAVVSIALLATLNIQITQPLTAGAQNVLGENEQSEEQKHAEEQQKEAEKQTEKIQEESTKKIEEQQKEAEKTKNTIEPFELPSSSIKSKTETLSPNGLQMKTEYESEKQETEIETTAGQKIKTKIEDDGTTKIENENGTVKLKYTSENGRVVLHVENEDGEEIEMENDELEELENEIEDELEDDNIKVVPTTDHQLALTQNQITAITDLPLSINVTTKELIITTASGQKVITVLPEEAVQNLLATGVINSIATTPSNFATQQGVNTLNGVLEIETRNNELVYKINGIKTHRMLGIIPVTTPITAFVSTETGLAVAKQQSVLTNIVDFLSP